MPASSASNGNTETSSLLTVCLVFVVHTFTNSILLSPLGNDFRCLFWEKEQCSADEEWILNWFSFSHFHVAILLAGMAHVSNGNFARESTLGYSVAGIIFIYLAEGIFSMEVLNPNLMQVQIGVFIVLLFAIMNYSWEQERNQPRYPLPRKLSTSSFDRRGKLSVSTIALFTQLLASLLRTLDMTLGGGHMGYKGNQSSSVYQVISKMAICDMMITVGLLGISLRFLEVEQQKTMLWYQVAALVVTLLMLVGSQGEMIEESQLQAGGIGTFILLTVGTLGAL